MSTQRSTKVIVDNWSLELVCQLLKGNLAYHSVPAPVSKAHLFSSAQYTSPYVQHYGVERLFFQEKVISLLNFLDILVLNDHILYDPEWSNYWKSFDTFDSIKEFLAEIRLGAKTKEKLSKPEDRTEHWLKITSFPNGIISDRNLTDDIVGGGAVYYYNLANLLGTYYWPSPRRASFIKENALPMKRDDFIILFKEFIDNQVQEQIQTTLLELGLSAQPLVFSGIGSAILANCDSSKSILTTAIQFRNSKESIALRAWLRELDIALETGNIAVIGRAIKDVRDSLESVQRKLGLKTEGKSNVELQIGLSPSITFDTEFITSTMERLKPKQLHLVFLREHFNRCLTDANVMRHIDRIFFN